LQKYYHNNAILNVTGITISHEAKRHEKRKGPPRYQGLRNHRKHQAFNAEQFFGEWQ